MFIGSLYPFQSIHEENLLRKCVENKELVLSAPTGSGKTVLACKFIDDYLDENPKTVFLWLCPGAGSLEKQSHFSFIEMMNGVPNGDVYDFINEPNCSGHVYFINWDKINKSSNTVLKEGERKNLMERVSECHRNGIDIFMIVDEEQKYRDTTERFINDMAPKHVLKISATPVTKTGYSEVITDEEVISAGLIASSISINEGLSDAIEENNSIDDDLLLIELADKKRKEITAEYEKLGINIRPLVLIQFPNGQDEWVTRVKNRLSDMGYGENSGLTTSWFSGDHPDDIDEIKKLNGKYAFLLFKQAIATGWDCPRAKILVKLREGGTEAFNIQTIGRIRRMPERRHYDNNVLDRCYIFTLDNEFKTGLTNSIAESFYSYLFKKKSDAPFIKLEKEYLDGSDKYAVNPEAVVKVLYDKFLAKYDTNRTGELTQKGLETHGFVFGTKLRTTAFEGVARTTDDIKKLNVIFGGEHQIDNHSDGFIIRDAKRRIARAVRVEENISNNALRILFGPIQMQFDIFSQEEVEFEKKYKLLSMSLREYNAFLVNNKEKLIELFSEVNTKEIADIEETEILKKDWNVPDTQYYRIHKKLPGKKMMRKNMYEAYLDSILVDPNRTAPERLFEEYCEKNDNIVAVYKNGDKGMPYFCIVYHEAFTRAHFYPDYIIKTRDGDVWIIETKGGFNSDFSSRNIDTLAAKKFDALKEYAARHPEIKWGFVRDIGSNLLLSNTFWKEEFEFSTWKRIEEFI